MINHALYAKDTLCRVVAEIRPRFKYQSSMHLSIDLSIDIY